MTRPFLSAKGVACETNEHKQEFYIVSQPGLTSFLKKEKGWMNCAYKLCSTTSYSAVMVLVSLVPRLYFSRLVWYSMLCERSMSRLSRSSLFIRAYLNSQSN